MTRSPTASCRAALAALAVLGCCAAAACGGPTLEPDRPPSHAQLNSTVPATSAAASAPTRTALPSAQPPPAPEPPPKLNVLVLTVDAMRADMPWAGYPRDIAPNLTKLEKQSVSYTRAYALSSYTAMSMAGFLSGRYPGEMQRSGYFFSAYPDEEVMFPELLQKADVKTLSAQAHFYFDQKAGFHQGFDVWRIVEGITVDHKTDRSITSPRHLKLATEILSDKHNTAGQFFAWFHFMDPHDLYMKHEGFSTYRGGMRGRYDGEIAFVDKHIADLLAFVKAQPWGKNTAIIISSDHGEAFGEHKRTRHGFEIYEMLVHVPMFFKIPGVAPKRITTPRGHIDLAPTIFELLGVPVPDGFQGHSLLPEMKGAVEPEQRDVIVDLPRTSHNDRRRALIWGRYKLISFGDDFRYELYDVVDDPGELKDLRRRDKATYEMMKKRYKERVKSIKDICPKMRHKLKNKRPELPC